MIHFFYTKFEDLISTKYWQSYLNLLPQDLQNKNAKYVRWQDQHSFVLGKLLLLQGFIKIGIDKKKIYELQYNKYGRPFLNMNVDFNYLTLQDT